MQWVCVCVCVCYWICLIAVRTVMWAEFFVPLENIKKFTGKLFNSCCKNQEIKPWNMDIRHHKPKIRKQNYLRPWKAQPMWKYFSRFPRNPTPTPFGFEHIWHYLSCSKARIWYCPRPCCPWRRAGAAASCGWCGVVWGGRKISEWCVVGWCVVVWYDIV